MLREEFIGGSLSLLAGWSNGRTSYVSSAWENNLDWQGQDCKPQGRINQRIQAFLRVVRAPRRGCSPLPIAPRQDVRSGDRHAGQ